MDEPLFFASRIKVERAEHFIRELEAELESYRRSRPLSAKLNLDEDPPTVSVRWASIPPRHGAIIGDALHNLRTALDLMASELARLNGESDKNVHFPFSDAPQDYDSAIRRKGFHKTGADAVALLKQFKPYRGGNELLRALHALDIQDKHTNLIPTAKHMNVKINGHYDAAKLDAQGMNVEGDIALVFPESGLLGGENVIQTLKDLVRLVNDILEAFASVVAQRKPSAPARKSRD